ncbi:MAG: putative DNA modification/repair radical SAM protein [Anaerostipes sp.]|jgi:putative DNA modification/repair radical SAM protein
MELLSGGLSLQEKLNILTDAAKYDVACTSSGSSRRGKKGHLGNTESCGICHSFASDGRCVSLLKILMSNECIYDCKYCLNRSSNECVRTTFTPDEICTLVVEFYRRNYIEGLFLSSGVVKNPTYTMELMYQAIFMLRNKYHFNGYIHVKAIPGASEELIAKLGYVVDRMSVNIELPTTEGLKTLAPHKNPKTLVAPIKQIQQGIADHRLATGQDMKMIRHRGNRYLKNTIFDKNPYAVIEQQRMIQASKSALPASYDPAPFVPAGQSTQMIIGATPENDYQLLSTTQKLYQMYDLKRVFFSAYVPLNEDALLPSLGTAPPLLREHRLYQADWLLRYYGFQADELLSEEKPNFNIMLDPKCDWALRHLEHFPIEINQASYETLLRVPGIGTKSAFRIIKARRQGSLNFEHLKKMGIVLKRAKYFITCSGKMMYRIPIEEDFITRQLIGEDSKKSWEIGHPDSYKQLSLFDDFNFESSVTTEDSHKSMLGQL